MKTASFGTRLTVLTLIFVLAGGIGGGASPLVAQQSGDRSGSETDTYRPGEPMEPRRMRQIHRRMMEHRQAMQLELEKKLRAMDDAEGDEKVDAMAEVIRELVHQRREMTSMMNAMHQQMHGMHMMMQGRGGMPPRDTDSGSRMHHERR